MCHRCGKPVALGEGAEQVFHHVHPRQVFHLYVYHEKCYPPVLFQKRERYRQQQRDMEALRERFRGTNWDASPRL